MEEALSFRTSAFALDDQPVPQVGREGLGVAGGANRSGGKGLMVKSGTLMDATLVESQGSRLGLRARHRRAVLHTCGRGSCLIRKAVLRTIRKWRTDYVLTGHLRHRRRQRLKSFPIVRRANKNHPTSRSFGTDESASEGGEGVRHAIRTRDLRSIGLERNATEMCFKCMAYNLRRADRIVLNGA